MSIGLVFLMSVVSVVSFLIVLIRTIGLRRVLKHATWVDVIFTVVTVLILAGSITGMLIGILAGLVMTGALTVLKALVYSFDAQRANAAKPVQPVHPCDDGWTPRDGWRQL